LAHVRYIPNRFADEIYIGSNDEITLLDCLTTFAYEHLEFNKALLGKKVCIYVNGENIHPDKWCGYDIKSNDIIEVTHTLEGGNSAIIQAVLGIALIAAGVALYFTGPVGWGMWSTGLTLMGASLLLGATIAYFFAPSMPKEPGGEETPSYSWDGPRTSISTDTPIALVYGKNLIGGNLVNFRLWSQDNDNWADMLIALCEGEIHGIRNEDDDATLLTDETVYRYISETGSHTVSGFYDILNPPASPSSPNPYIKINDSLLSSYSDVKWMMYRGTNSQDISGFRAINTVYPYSHRLTRAWSVTYTTNDDINEFSVIVEAPSGLYRVDNDGEVHPEEVSFQIHYKLNSSPTWIPMPFSRCTTHASEEECWYGLRGETKTTQRRTITVDGLATGTYDIQVRRRDDPSTGGGKSLTSENTAYVTSITETIYKDLDYPNTAVLSISMRASNQISGTFPNVLSLIEGRKVSVPNLGGDRQFEDYYWTGTGNQFRRLSDDGGLVEWNGSSYITQYTSNPAYCLRDLLTNTRFGLGDFVLSTDLDDDTINLTAKKQWQKHDTSYHKHELNIVIDKQASPSSVLQSFALAGRMIIFWSGGYIKFKYLEDEAPVQLFNMSNILQGSFSAGFVAQSEIPNIVEAQFASEDDDYVMDTREIMVEAEITADKPPRRKTISFLGITNEAQLLREAKYAINSAWLCNKTVEFKAAIDAVHCEPGDLVLFQHDVTNWGYGGRVISGTTNSIVIDTESVNII